MRLTGHPCAQISTPDGLIALNHQGYAPLTQASTIAFISARIADGGLVGYVLEDDAPKPEVESEVEPESKKKK